MTRKIKADDIFTGTEFTGPGHVLVTDEKGAVEAIIREEEAGEGIENVEGILCPGFINAHCHIELSHLKNKIHQHTGLVDFVQNVMTGREASNEEKQEAMHAAEEELYNSGTVAIGDICNTTDSILLKKKSRIYWHNFIEISGFVPAGAQKRFEDATEILKAFRQLKEFQHSTLSPHAPYSVSKKLFELINEATANQIISIHNQESAEENKLYQNKSGKFLELYENFGIDISGFIATGKNSMPSWLPYFNRDQKIICVHNTFTCADDIQPPAGLKAAAGVYTSDDDIQPPAGLKAAAGVYTSADDIQPPAGLKAAAGVYFCLCPNANLYIENTMPPVQMLINNNCNIVLGTDSYASNTQLNIFEEIKTLQKNFPEIPLQIMLQWATINGARGLGIENKFGSFEKGKQPGLVLISNGSAKRIGDGKM